MVYQEVFQRKANGAVGKWTEKGSRPSSGATLSKTHSGGEVGITGSVLQGIS